MTTTHDSALLLGTERLSKLLLKYALPAIVAMSATSLYNMVDSIFIGQGVDAMALSGMAITMPLMNMAAAFGSLVGIGAATLLSIRMGQNDKNSANSILGNVVIMNTVIGGLYSLAILPFLSPILYYFGASDLTLPYARDYLLIILSCNMISNLYLGMNDMLRASGYPSKAMRIMLTAVVLNCLLDALFILGFGWEIAGAAWATVIAQIVALGLELIHFFDKKHAVHFVRESIRLNKHIIKGILSIGMSPFLMYLCSSLVVMLINRSLAGNGGDLYIGAYSIINRMAMLFIMIIMGLNQGMQPIVGYNYGARNYDRVMRTLKYVILAAVTVSSTGFLIGEILPFYAARMFTPDAELINIATDGMRIVFIMFPLVGFQMVTSNFFQSIGMAPKAIFLSLTRQLIFLIPFLMVMPLFFGRTGVWMSMPMADALASVLSGYMLWRQIKIFKGLKNSTTI